jgi:hypothetical protein
LRDKGAEIFVKYSDFWYFCSKYNHSEYIISAEIQAATQRNRLGRRKVKHLII